MQDLKSRKSQFNNEVPYDPVAWYAMETEVNVEDAKHDLSELSLKNAFEGKGVIEFFLPKCLMQETVPGKKEPVTKEMPCSYVFFHNTKEGINEIKNTLPHLNLLKPMNLDGNRAHVKIDDESMVMFRKIVTVFNGLAPCYYAYDYDVEAMDLAKVEDGPFKGVKGRFYCKPGKNSGQVLVPINKLFIVATAEIQPEHLRTLEFGKRNHNSYHKHDVHLPRAIKALFTKLTLGEIDFNQTNEMKAFILHFSLLKPRTLNTKSTHIGQMLMSQKALGNEEEAQKWLIECEKILPMLKADIQIGLHIAMMYAATGDEKLLERLHNIVDGWGEIAETERKKQRIAGMMRAFEGVYDSLKWIKQ